MKSGQGEKSKEVVPKCLHLGCIGDLEILESSYSAVGLLAQTEYVRMVSNNRNHRSKVLFISLSLARTNNHEVITLFREVHFVSSEVCYL